MSARAAASLFRLLAVGGLVCPGLAPPANAQTNLYREVISREFSMHVETGTPETEVASREFSIRVENGTEAGELVSREFVLSVADGDAPPPVTGIDVTVSPTGEVVTLDWTAYNPWQTRDIGGFRIFLSDTGPLTDISGLTPFATVDGETTTFTLTGLAAFTDHFLAVVAVDSQGNLDPLVNYAAAYVVSPEMISREVSLFVGQELTPPDKELASREYDLAVAGPDPPPAIAEFDVTVSPLGDRATLDWSGYNQWEHAPVDRFEIYLSDTEPITDVGDLTPVATARGGDTAITLDGLTPNTDHFFAVVPVDSLDAYDPAVHYGAAYVLSPEVVSREISIRVGNETMPGYRELVSREFDILVPDAAVPPPVTGLDSGFFVETSTEAFGAVVLDFTGYNEPAVGDIVGYDVYVADAFFDDVTGLTPFAALPAGTLRQTLSGLPGGSINHFAVVAVDALENFDPAVRSFSAQASISGVGEVANLAATSTADSLAFTWDPPADAAEFLDAYRVRLGDEPPVDLPITETSFEASGLPRATGFSFRISTVDIFGNESPGTSLNTATWLNPPPNLRLTLADGEVVARWDAPAPEALVAFYRIYEEAGNFSDVGGLTPRTTTAATEAVLGDLDGVRDRWFAVTAVNALGDADPAVVAVQADKQAQTIDFPSPAAGPSPIPLAATATSGLPVAFAVAPETTAVIVDDGGPALEILRGGPVEITATQDGDADWWPAPPVTRELRLPPVIESFTVNGTELADGAVIGALDNLLRVTALDADGIASAEFFLRPEGGDFASLGLDGIPGDGLTAMLATEALTPGPHELKVVVATPGGVTAERTHAVTIELRPPPGPAIAAPLDGARFEVPTATVSGTAQRGSQVEILRDGGVIGGPAAADAAGNFGVEIPLAPGLQSIAARATNAAGTGPESPAVEIELRSILTLGLSPATLTEGETTTLNVGRNHPQGAITVKLGDDSPGQLNFPASVDLAGGESQTRVTVAAVDDLVAELDAGVLLTATAPGHTSAGVQVTVLDDDRPTLTLKTNRSSVTEGSPPGELIATITRSPVTDTPFTIKLASGDPDSLFSNAEVIIPSFTASVEVVVETPDNDESDGDRTVFLTASTLDVTTDEPLSVSNEAEVLVTDDDGPALSLSIPRLALQEGSNTTAEVSRNRPTGGSLEVTLTSSDTSGATVPPTVTIPAGAGSVGFPVAAVDDAVDDGNQPLLLNATADGFSQAQLAVTVTDLLLPDLAVTSLEPPVDPLTNETVRFSYRVENQGPVDVALPIGVRAYLSSDAIVDPDDERIGTLSFEGGIPAGGFFEGTLSFITPRESGAYRILLRLDAEQAIEEILETNNVGATPAFTIAPAYTAAVSTATSIAASGTPVDFAGRATLARGGPAVSRLVNIHLMVRGTTRLISALTDSNGDFTATFHPLPGEGGVYSVGAAHPGVPAAPVQDSFTLLGFSTEPESLELTPLREGPGVVGTVRLTNLTDFPLESIAVSGFDLPSGIRVTGSQVGPAGVDPLGTAEVEYRVSATAGAPAEAEGFIRFTTPEGALLDLPLRVLARESTSRLVGEGGVLERGMIPGERRFLNFRVRNEGGVESGPVRVLTPAGFDWMSVVSGSPLPSIPPGGEIGVTLELSPADDFPLGLTTGNLIVAGDHNQLSVPFSLRSVSDGIGDLVVRCEDEFTYFASGNPPLAGALVRVLDPFTKAEVASGTSGPDGLVTFPDLTEGAYEIRASEPNHATVRRTVSVGAGDPTDVTLFLRRNTVTYRWTVVPTEIEDRYRVVIETEFETNVPAPVVTVEPTYIDLTELPDEVNQVEFTITNHGLIAADNVTLNFNSGTNWRIEALASKLGTLPAGSQYKVPVTITRLNGGRAGGCGPGGSVSWNYECGDSSIAGGAGVGFGGDGANCGGGIGGGGAAGGAGGGFIPAGSAGIGSCDPCVLKALIDCGFGFGLDPVTGCVYAGGRFYMDCKGKGDDINCLIDFIQLGGGCACGFSPYGTACTAANCFIDLLQCLAASGGANSRSYAEILQVFEDRGRDVTAMVELELAMLGDPAWSDLLETPGIEEFWDLYKATIDGDAAPSQSIDAGEEAALLASIIGQANPVLVGELVARWNRTLDYWAAGYRTIDQVPDGLGTDFIDQTTIDEATTRVVAAFDRARADGFEDPLEAFGAAVDGLFDFLTTGGGVCARVRLQIEQEAVMTRDAFDATLALDNSGDEPLDDIDVDIRILDLDGFEVTDRFGIAGPEVVGASGTTLAGQSAGSWSWTLVPGQDAAPAGPVVYQVFGGISYTVGGEEVNIPLLPRPITVYPNPNLRLKYFHQRDVYSDDPFTDPIEPAIPFSLGVMIENTGTGPARDLSITSGQPEIIENEKGLLIDFEIIATRIGDRNLSPSLTADFGTIQPGETKVAEWRMISNLQGLFLNYSAEFEHLDDFGGTRSSLIEEVDIFETIRAVKALGARDDGLPDFLVNATFDVLDLPDEIHLSDGSVEPVAVSRSASAGPPEPGNLSVTLSDTGLGAGWGYLRVPDPGGGDFRLVSCVRSDGLAIPLDTNVWTTDRTFIGLGLRPIEEDLLHLVDSDSTGSYTLTYAAVEPPDVTAPSSAVAALPTDSGSFIEVSWSGSDDVGVARYDIFVSINGGPFELWRENTPETSALFVGDRGATYEFHSIAIDEAGNREAPKSAGEAATAVTLENQPPVLDPVGTLAVNEGETLIRRFTATDPDGPDDALAFSLDSPHPGVTLDPDTGRLRWITSEEDGGRSVEITVTVTDGDPQPLSDSLTLTIEVVTTNAPPVLDDPGSFAIDVGEPLSVQLSATDGDVPAQTVRYRLADGQPSGMMLDPASGLVEWTPGDEHEERTFAVRVEAFDDQTPEGAAARTLFVEVLKKPGLPPEFDPFPALVWKTDGVHRVPVTASDPEGEPVTLTADLSALGAGWPSFAAEPGSGAGTLTWGAWGAAPGIYQISLTASTDRQSITAELPIEIVARDVFADYDGWTSAYGLTPLDSLIDRALNPRGLDNLFIYAFGLDPRGGLAPGQPAPGPLPLEDAEGLRFILPEGGLGRADLEYVVERSVGDLGNWQPVAAKSGHDAWTGEGFTVGESALQGGLTEVRIGTGPLPGGPVFLRLRLGFPEAGASAFQTWMAGFPTPDDGPGADPNGDRLANLLAWSLGHASPLATTLAEREAVPRLVGGPGEPGFRVTLLGGAKADVRYLVETSPDLRRWQPVAVKRGAEAWFSEVPLAPATATPPDESWDFDLLPGPGGFVRLRVDPLAGP